MIDAADRTNTFFFFTRRFGFTSVGRKTARLRGGAAMARGHWQGGREGLTTLLFKIKICFKICFKFVDTMSLGSITMNPKTLNPTCRLCTMSLTAPRCRRRARATAPAPGVGMGGRRRCKLTVFV